MISCRLFIPPSGVAFRRRLNVSDSGMHKFVTCRNLWGSVRPPAHMSACTDCTCPLKSKVDARFLHFVFVMYSPSLALFLFSGWTHCFLSVTFSCYSAKYNKQRISSSCQKVAIVFCSVHAWNVSVNPIIIHIEALAHLCKSAAVPIHSGVWSEMITNLFWLSGSNAVWRITLT